MDREFTLEDMAENIHREGGRIPRRLKVGGKTRLCANACRAIYFYVNWTLISIGYTNGSNINIQAYYRCTSTTHTHLFTRVYKNY